MMKKRKPGEPITLAWIRSNCVETDTSCWEWQRARNSDGYGSIKSQGRTLGAHCVAFQLAGGIIPPGQCVLHSCDKPACCNPDHLSTGTQLKNIQDRNAKGRDARGEKIWTAKLTPEEVRLIRTSPGSHVEKAKMFGVTSVAISSIMRGASWAHVQ